MKFNATRMVGLDYLENTGNRIDSIAEFNHNRWRQTQQRIEELGYRDMSTEKYLEWVTAMEAEKKKQKAQADKNINR